MFEKLLETMQLLFQTAMINISSGKEQAKKFIREKVKPGTKSYFKAVILLVALTFIPSMALTYAGIANDSDLMIIIGGVWRAICSLLLLIILAPLGLLIEISTGGLSGSGARYIKRVMGVFIFELVFTIFVAAIPIENNHSLFPLFILTYTVLGMLNALTFQTKIIVPAVIIIFIWIVASFMLPGIMGKLGHKMRKADTSAIKPEEVELDCSIFDSTEFFDAKGDPNFLYFMNEKTGEIKLFTRPSSIKVYHRRHKKELKPISEEIIDAMEKDCAVKNERRKKMAADEEKRRKNEPPKQEWVNYQPFRQPEILTEKKEEEIPNEYIADNSMTNMADTSEIAVMIIDKQKRFVSGDEKIISSFQDDKTKATGSLFTQKFITDKLFDKIFNGIGDNVTKLNLYKYVDYVILGKKSKTSISKNSSVSRDARFAKVLIDVRVVSAKTGKIINSFEASGEGLAYSPDTAEKFAISAAMGDIKRRI